MRLEGLTKAVLTSGFTGASRGRPFQERVMNNFIKIMIVAVGIFTSTTAQAHPDGATPYWYPGSYVYGFINGCWETIELSETLITQEMWPAEIKAVCGCVVDALRHSISFVEIEDSFHDPGVQLIVSATLPICIEEQETAWVEK